MQTVETGQSEERRAKDGGLGSEVLAKQARVLVELPTKESGTHKDGQEEKKLERALIAMGNNTPPETYRNTTTKQRKRVNQRIRQFSGQMPSTIPNFHVDEDMENICEAQ